MTGRLSALIKIRLGVKELKVRVDVTTFRRIAEEPTGICAVNKGIRRAAPIKILVLLGAHVKDSGQPL